MKAFKLVLGQHLKKSSLSESSSSMDLDDGVESTPGVIGDQTRIVPFLGTHNLNDKQQQNCCKPSGQNLQQRHNSALAVSIETVSIFSLAKSCTMN